MRPQASGRRLLERLAQELQTCGAAAKFLAPAERPRQILATRFLHPPEIRWRLLFLDSLLLVDALWGRQDLTEIHAGAGIHPAVPAVPRGRGREDLRRAAHRRRDHRALRRRARLVDGRTKQPTICGNEKSGPVQPGAFFVAPHAS